MITGDTPNEWLQVSLGGVDVKANLVSAQVTHGGNMMPYQCAPDIGQGTMNLYYEPGATVPSFEPGGFFSIDTQDPVSGSFETIFDATIADVVYSNVLDEATGSYGTRVTAYAYNRIAQLNQIFVPGVITSAATKNQTWEQRLGTLEPYFPFNSAIFPTTALEKHIYRLVDNNINGTLVDQVNLACNSVGATWYVGTSKPSANKVVFQAKGVYSKTGALFTDDPTYWNAGNKPANAGSSPAYNLTYKTLEMSFDSRNLVNEIIVENVMPKNVILSTNSPGTLLYKDPATTRVDALEVVTPTYTASNATSITTYGRRPSTLQTNLYPYRTTDTEGYYLRPNAYLDPGVEYREAPAITCSNANIRISSTTPETGTYCYDVVTTTGGSAYELVIGDPAGYPLKVIPSANTNVWTLSWRTAQANARFRRNIQYLDSNGNVLLTQSSVLITPTLNTWATPVAAFMDYTAIPAGTVAWRPTISITHATGSFGAGTTIAKLDNISINSILQPAGLMSGDTADTGSNVYWWESFPGTSWSYQQRNILDNIASDALTYLKDGGLAPRYLEWNLRQEWSKAAEFQPGGRVDIHFNGSNYVAWIDRVSWEIDSENVILKLDLSRRPTSWI